MIQVMGTQIDSQVKLRLPDSIVRPLANWAMLCIENYACITNYSASAIGRKVYTNLKASTIVHAWGQRICIPLRANENELVLFKKNARMAQELTTPYSKAHALLTGPPNIRYVVEVTQPLATSQGVQYGIVHDTVTTIYSLLQKSRVAPNTTP